MRLLRWRLLPCTLLCWSWASAQPQPVSPKPHVVVVVTSDVTFRRLGWTQSAPVRFGTALLADDLLTFGPGASAVIVCDGFATKATIAGPGIKPVPCGIAASQIPIDWNHGQLIPTAHIDVPSSSFTTSTWLRTYENKPNFAWPAVPGADSYEVAVRGHGVDWKATTTTTTVASPSILPKLEFDQAYDVSVVPMLKKKPLPGTQNGRPLFTQRFQVVSLPRNLDITAVIGALSTLGLPQTVVTFLTGRLQALSGRYDAAIVSLLGLRGQLNEPALSRELGEVYRAKGSYGDAEKLLSDAVLLYQKNGDIIGRALAEEAIANIQVKSPGRITSAIAHLRTALQTYQTLGDKPDTERVQTSLKSLDQLNTRQPRR